MERRVKATEVKVTKPTLDQLRGMLSIDEDDLDGALLEQPDLYFHVAEGYVEAVAERDAVKLDLEEAQAVLDTQFRREAVEREERITEAAIQRKIADTPRIKTLERDYLSCRERTDKWQALKEAFQQRSFMLRELVAIRIANFSNLTIERGVRGAQYDLSNAVRAAAGELREQRSVRRGRTGDT